MNNNQEDRINMLLAIVLCVATTIVLFYVGTRFTDTLHALQDLFL